MTENELSYSIIGAAIEVHKELGGPGLLEDLYEEALCEELRLREIAVERQIAVPVFYKGQSTFKEISSRSARREQSNRGGQAYCARQSDLSCTVPDLFKVNRQETRTCH